MLGTTDAGLKSWNDQFFDFINDYTELINSFKNMASKPQVHVMLPPPVYNNQSSAQIVTLWQLPNIIPDIVKKTGTSMINILEALGGQQLQDFELFCDHQNCDKTVPNHAGQTHIASTVYKALFNP